MRVQSLLAVALILYAWTATVTGSAHSTSESLRRQPSAAFRGFPREEMRLSTSPYTAVGRLTFSGHLWCTATLIGRDLILTAAHCLFDENHKMRKTAFRFTPATWMNREDSSLVTKFWSATNNIDAHPDLDFAVLHLEKPLGDKYGWMTLQPKDGLKTQRPIEFVSYSDDFQSGRKATYQKGCGFTFYPWETPGKEVFKMMGHTCAGFDGASGASFFYTVGSEGHIVGLNVRGSRDGCRLGPKKPCNKINYDDDHANAGIPSDRMWPLIRYLLPNADAAR